LEPGTFSGIHRLSGQETAGQMTNIITNAPPTVVTYSVHLSFSTLLVIGFAVVAIIVLILFMTGRKDSKDSN
jgi:hypothetical protein